MKLHETDISKFNELVSAEPDSTIYQTSFYSDQMVAKGYRAVFLEAEDDSDICVALCMLLIKKESLLSSKLSAYAPFGFLINYYDEALLRQFHQMLTGYLKHEKVSKLIIEPQVPFGNHSVEKILNDLGYEKKEDLSIYAEDVLLHEDELSDPNVVLKIRCIDDDSILRKLITNKKESDKLKLFENLKEHGLCYVAQLDGFKSRRALEESIGECEQYIKVHKDDYKFVEAVAEKENEAKQLKKVFNTINRFENELKEDPDIAALCIADFSDHYSIMYKVNLDKEDLFHCEKEMIDQICADCQNRGIIKVDSVDPFIYSKEKKLLGRYELKI